MRTRKTTCKSTSSKHHDCINISSAITSHHLYPRNSRWIPKLIDGLEMCRSSTEYGYLKYPANQFQGCIYPTTRRISMYPRHHLQWQRETSRWSTAAIGVALDEVPGFWTYLDTLWRYFPWLGYPLQKKACIVWCLMISFAVCFWRKKCKNTC